MSPFVVVLVLSALSLPLSAQIGGNSTYRFLDLPAPARIAALGGSLVAVSDRDAGVGYFNPSALNASMDGMVTLNSVIYFRGINFGYAGYARDYGRRGTFMGGVQYINYGKFQGADATGVATGNFYAGETALHLAWGMERYPWSYGAAVKAVGSFLESYSSLGAAGDLAVSYRDTAHQFMASAVVRNAGYQVKPYRSGNREPLPFDIQASVSQRLEHLPLRLFLTAHHLYRFDIRYDDPYTDDATFNLLDTTQIREKKHIADKIMRHFIIGGEFYLGKNLELRLSYNYLRRKELSISTRTGLVGFSWGLGVRVRKMRLEYAMAEYNLAGFSNHFSLLLNLHDMMPGKRKG